MQVGSGLYNLRYIILAIIHMLKKVGKNWLNQGSSKEGRKKDLYIISQRQLQGNMWKIIEKDILIYFLYTRRENSTVFFLLDFMNYLRGLWRGKNGK